MMNVLSPKMPEATFRDYVGWMRGQGANTAHVFLINKGDGEYSGYSPWGVGVGPGAGVGYHVCLSCFASSEPISANGKPPPDQSGSGFRELVAGR